VVPILLKNKNFKIYVPELRGFAHSSYNKLITKVDDLA